MTSLKKEIDHLLKRKRLKRNAIPVTKVPKLKNHKLGIDETGLPMFFILCEDGNQSAIDSDLELIRVEFSRKCELVTEANKTIEGYYTIISLKSNSLEIQGYFLEIVYLLLSSLPEKIRLKDLKVEIAKLVSLFSRLTEPPKKTIQGLWAELLVIEQSSNPLYLINSWHISPSDKFDFNDGTDKLEIKSTLKNRRVHSFSNDQLNPNINSRLLVASVLVIQSGSGKNVFDLSTLIEARVDDPKSLFKMKENIASTLGKDFERAQGIFYDYSFSKDHLAFYPADSLPSISPIHVPYQISNIHFDCDLTSVAPIKKSNIKSKLHKSAV